MEGSCSNIISLALTNQTVVLQDEFLLGFVALTLRGQHPLGFVSMPNVNAN